jgi:hypothetical protein
MLGFIWKGVKTIFGGGGLVKDLFGMLQDGVKAKRELKQVIALAKIERVNKLDTADVDWNMEMAEQARDSWKDEWLTIWVTILVFGIPTFSWVADVWNGDGSALARLPELYTAIELVPEWLKVANGIVFAGSFGVKPAIKWMSGKKAIQGE